MFKIYNKFLTIFSRNNKLLIKILIRLISFLRLTIDFYIVITDKFNFFFNFLI